MAAGLPPARRDGPQRRRVERQLGGHKVDQGAPSWSPPRPPARGTARRGGAGRALGRAGGACVLGGLGARSADAGAGTPRRCNTCCAACSTSAPRCRCAARRAGARRRRRPSRRRPRPPRPAGRCARALPAPCPALASRPHCAAAPTPAHGGPTAHRGLPLPAPPPQPPLRGILKGGGGGAPARAKAIVFSQFWVHLKLLQRELAARQVLARPAKPGAPRHAPCRRPSKGHGRRAARGCACRPPSHAPAPAPAAAPRPQLRFVCLVRSMASQEKQAVVARFKRDPTVGVRGGAPAPRARARRPRGAAPRAPPAGYLRANRRRRPQPNFAPTPRPPRCC